MDEWPLRIARPIKHSSQEVAQTVENLILNVSTEKQIPKEVLMRKKWMNALYQHVVFQRDEQDLPRYLLGWRYEALTQPLLKILMNDKQYLSMQMEVFP